MSDLDKRLEEYKKNSEAITTKEFKDFGELEKEYCTLINEGNQIRRYNIINNYIFI